MKSKRTGREVGSGTGEGEREALKLCCHTGCCWSAGSVMEEGLTPFSRNFVSMMMTTRRSPTVEVAASEAGGSPRQPLGGDGTRMGGEEEGRAQSHWEGAGSSQGSRGEQAGQVEVVEEAMGTLADGVGPSAAPGVPTGGSPSSASLA